jgi:Flp pilus assembly protein TadB
MKLPSLFTKTPNYKRFAYTPRHYDPLEEERKEREERIRHELSIESDKKADDDSVYSYRSRIAGSFRSAKKTATVQKDPSANMLRLVILLVLAIGLIAFIEYGMIALYGVALIIVPFYFYLKFRKFRR